MPEEVKPVVVVEPEEKDTSQEPVDVTPKTTLSEQDQLVAKVKADFEGIVKSQVGQVQSQFDNFRHGAYRVQDDLKKENAALKLEMEKLKKPVSSAPSGNVWESIQDGSKWKSEIEGIAEQKAQEKFQALQAQEQQKQATERFKIIRQQCVAQIAEKYPDLHPETGTEDSPIAQAFKRVTDAHPEVWQDAYGPLAAMSLMEQDLAKQGKNGAPLPAGKVRASMHLPPSRSGPSAPASMTLTREQKAFCDRHNLKPEDYLKTLTALEQGAVEA